jgi:deoxyadenosine/deoxycytidine kinase
MTDKLQPLLVEFVGMPGSGKSTIANALVEKLSVLGHVVNKNRHDGFRSWAMLDSRMSWLVPVVLTVRMLTGGPPGWGFFFLSLRWCLQFRPMKVKLIYDAMVFAVRYVWMCSLRRRAVGGYIVTSEWLVNFLLHHAARHNHAHPDDVARIMQLYMRMNVLLIHVHAQDETIVKRLSERQRIIHYVQRMPDNDRLLYKQKFDALADRVLAITSHFQHQSPLVVSGTDDLENNVTKILSMIGASAARLNEDEGTPNFQARE